jgi:hypothetical protein
MSVVLRIAAIEGSLIGRLADTDGFWGEVGDAVAALADEMIRRSHCGKVRLALGERRQPEGSWCQRVILPSFILTTTTVVSPVSSHM